jgi:hypothetical protein
VFKDFIKTLYIGLTCSTAVSTGLIFLRRELGRIMPCLSIPVGDRYKSYSAVDNFKSVPKMSEPTVMIQNPEEKVIQFRG